MEYMSVEVFRHFLAAFVFPPLMLCALALSFWLYLELRSQPVRHSLSAHRLPLTLMPYRSGRHTVAGQAAQVAHQRYLDDLRMKRYQKYQGNVRNWHRGTGNLQKVSLYAAS
jgi:hypothetical protein